MKINPPILNLPKHLGAPSYFLEINMQNGKMEKLMQFDLLFNLKRRKSGKTKKQKSSLLG